MTPGKDGTHACHRKAARPRPALQPPRRLYSGGAAGGGTLRLVTQYGYVETTEPFDQVQGDVEITGVDWDSSHAYVMEYRGVLCGNRGPFTGRKMAVEDFLKTYPQGTLDIMDETYGYRQVKLDGFLNLTGRCLEFRLELYYSGEFRYLLKEPAPGAAV